MMGALDHSFAASPAAPARLAMRAPQEVFTRDHFLFGALLGLGSYSKVVKAKRKDTGEVFALKIMNKRHIIRESKVKFVKMERMILDQLDHPGVVRLCFTFQDVHSLYMGLECCSDGELFDQIRRKKRMSEDETRFYTAEIVEILDYIHGQGVIHRDIKPENLLIAADGHLKLCDFGSAKMVRPLPNGFFQAEGENAAAFVGTAEYVSPEVLHGIPVSHAVDLWALGCTVYQMLEGRPPFKAATEYLIFQKVMARELSMPSHFSPEAKDLVERLLNLVPNERLGAQGYDEIRNHPFFKGFDWSRLRRMPAPKLHKESSCGSTTVCTCTCCPQQLTRTQCMYVFNGYAVHDSIEDIEDVLDPGRASTSALVPLHSSGSKILQAKHNLLSKSGEEPLRQQGNHLSEDSLQWLQALELQVVGACRSDERLRPILRWNVSCFGSDGLLAHLGQHFKARELALLARCLSTPVVSLRVGKVSRHGRYLYPTSARGYLNLMLLPCSEMRLSFADDVGTVERVAVTIPGVESGGILIEELKEDTSQRTFVLKDHGGNITNYFWQSEKLKSTGDELITKIRNMLKRRPTLAHLTGIDEGRLDSFADYLRSAIFSKASTALSQMAIPTQLLPSLESNDDSLKSPPSKSVTLPLRRPLLKFSSFPKLFIPTDAQNHIPSLASHRSRMGEPVASQPSVSSMDKLRRYMREIDSSICSVDGPLSSFASSLPATAKLIESLKRLRNCLHSLSDRRSSKARTLGESLPSSSQVESQIKDLESVPYSKDGAHLMKYITEPQIRNVLSAAPFAIEKYKNPEVFSPGLLSLRSKTRTLDPCPSTGTEWDVTVVYRDLGPTLDPAWSSQAHPVQYCPSVTEVFDFRRPLICRSDAQFLFDLFTQLVSQMPLMISLMPSETLCTHNLYVLPLVFEHSGASSLPHLSVLPHVLDHLRLANLLHFPFFSRYGVPFLRKSLSTPPAPDQSVSRRRGAGPHFVVMHPTVRLRQSGSSSRKLDPGMEICQEFKARSLDAQCGTCHPCATGLGNLVLVNFYVQQPGPRLRVVTAEITSGNISYIVRFLQSF